MSLKDYKKKK